MGVKECDRRGCERILCDSYSSEHGYICEECKSELMDKVLQGESINVAEFMATPKAGKSSVVSSEFEVNEIFPVRG